MIDVFDGQHRFLSNFYTCIVRCHGLVYNSVETAYQSCKTLDPELWKEFSGMTAVQAKRAGKLIKVRDGWHSEEKLRIMEELLRQKFGPANPYLVNKLLDTGEQELIEGNWWGDTFWGICRGKGTNHLGVLLMKIRKELRDELQPQTIPTDHSPQS